MFNILLNTIFTDIYTSRRGGDLHDHPLPAVRAAAKIAIDAFPERSTGFWHFGSGSI